MDKFSRLKSGFQKSTALLIVLLIISSLGLMALLVAKSSVSLLGVSARTSNEMIADEAAYAGLEMFLLYKNQSFKYLLIDKDAGSILPEDKINCNYDPQNNYPFYNPDSHTINCPTTDINDIRGANNYAYQIVPYREGDTIKVYVTGQYNYAYKKHFFIINEDDTIEQVY